MAATRDFDAARRERNRERSPIEFSLGGETFRTLAVVPAGAALDLIDAPSLAMHVRQFLRAVLVDTDEVLDDDQVVVIASSRDRFEVLCYRRDDPIDGESLIEVVDFLAEEYSGRPTERSSDSSDGPPSTGATSNGHSSPEVSRIPPIPSTP